MTGSLRFALVALTLLWPTAASADVKGDGFEHPLFAYGIKFADPQAMTFVDDDWVIESHRVYVRNGAPIYYDKGGDDWTTFRRIDMDGDGRVGKTEGVRVPAVDIQFEHRPTGGSMFVLSFRLLKDVEKRKLSVLLSNLAEAMSGTGQVSVFDRGVGVTVSREYATKITERKKGQTAGGTETLEATIEVANVSQLQLDPTHRDKFIRIVMFKVPMRRAVLSTDQRSPTALVIAAYVNRPSEYPEALPAFQKLVSGIHTDKAAMVRVAAKPKKARRATREWTRKLVYVRSDGSDPIEAAQGLTGQRVSVSIPGGRSVDGQLKEARRGELLIVEDDGMWTPVKSMEILKLVVLEPKATPKKPEAAPAPVPPPVPGRITVLWTRGGGTSLSVFAEQLGKSVVVELRDGGTVSGVIKAADAATLVLELGGALKVLKAADIETIREAGSG